MHALVRPQVQSEVRFREGVMRHAERSMLEPKLSPLIGPDERDTSQEQVDGEHPRLAAFSDGRDDIGSQVGGAQKAADMRVAQPKASGYLGGVRIFAGP